MTLNRDLRSTVHDSLPHTSSYLQIGVIRILRALFFLIGLVAALVAQAEGIPVESFFRSPGFTRFRISPSGEYLSALGSWKDGMNLYVIDLKLGTSTRITATTDQTINHYLWASKERILFTMDQNGNESWGLFAVNRDGSNLRTLVPPLGSTGSFVFRYSRPLDLLRDHPDEILILNNERRVDYPDVYRMNINNGVRRLAVRNPGNFTGWRTDQDGEVRLGEARDHDGGVTYYFREKGKKDWGEIAYFPFGKAKWRPVGPPEFDQMPILVPPPQPFSYDHLKLYVASEIGRTVSAIFEFDPQAKEMGRMLFQTPSHDVVDLQLSDFLERPLGVYYETEKPEVFWFDEEKRIIQAYLERKFPGFHSRVVNTSDDHTKMVVASYSDRHPVVYSLLSIDKGELNLEILADNRVIETSMLGEMRPIRFEARDGTPLHGYLTLPTDQEPRNLPLIVHPHGGPWVRDSWGYNPVVQFLANRGFAVLQIDFRSSLGYGWAFLHAGDKLWGSNMQTDLVDGVKWATERGIADPNSIGIYGSSYGGYAALAQLTKFPEIYKFGISAFGPVDLIELINWRRKWKQEMVYGFYCRTIGHPENDRDLLARFSPINYIERIQAPIFIVHGSQDPRVPIDHAKVLRRELRKKGKDFVWLVKKDEGHGFRKVENQIELYTMMDAFLKRFR